MSKRVRWEKDLLRWPYVHTCLRLVRVQGRRVSRT